MMMEESLKFIKNSCPFSFFASIYLLHSCDCHVACRSGVTLSLKSPNELCIPGDYFLNSIADTILNAVVQEPEQAHLNGIKQEQFSYLAFNQ